jgi:hypothetical protein
VGIRCLEEGRGRRRRGRWCRLRDRRQHYPLVSDATSRRVFLFARRSRCHWRITSCPRSQSDRKRHQKHDKHNKHRSHQNPSRRSCLSVAKQPRRQQSSRNQPPRRSRRQKRQSLCSRVSPLSVKTFAPRVTARILHGLHCKGARPWGYRRTPEPGRRSWRCLQDSKPQPLSRLPFPPRIQRNRSRLGSSRPSRSFIDLGPFLARSQTVKTT